MGCSLVVSIDTEEEGLWGGHFDTHPQTQNLRGLERFQRFCDEREVVPTYLIDAPVLADSWAVERLRKWQDSDRCEVGAHCHAWCNPPLDDCPVTEQSSYLCNLAESLQRQKLEWLTHRIELDFGRRPTSFRAGRYGLDHVGAKILSELGYSVDSSVLPFHDYRVQGGPNFMGATMHPYRVSMSNLLKTDPTGRLLEVPITAGYTHSGFVWRNFCRRVLTETPLRWLRLAGVLDRLNLLRRLKFSPEQAGIRDAQQLVDAVLAEGVGVIVLMFHSSSLLPGFSPYVKTPADLDQFYVRLARMVDYCLIDKGCESTGLTMFASRWNSL
jgi:hypothetical protein